MLTAPQIRVLTVLQEAGGPMSLREIREACYLRDDDIPIVLSLLERGLMQYFRLQTVRISPLGGLVLDACRAGERAGPHPISFLMNFSLRDGEPLMPEQFGLDGRARDKDGRPRRNCYVAHLKLDGAIYAVSIRGMTGQPQIPLRAGGSADAADRYVAG